MNRSRSTEVIQRGKEPSAYFEDRLRLRPISDENIESGPKNQTKKGRDEAALSDGKIRCTV
jgi:hypothetical protein